MRNQRRTKAPYSKESLGRALAHHEHTRAIHTYSPPSEGRPTWRINFDGFESVELTTPQVYALCLGLAAAERAYARREEAK